MRTEVDPTIPSADEVEEIVKENAAWATRFIVETVRSLLRDGRPLFTMRVPSRKRLEAVLNAPRPFWQALSERDPETAAALVADVIRARSRGELAMTGPRAVEVTAQDMTPALAELKATTTVPSGILEQTGRNAAEVVM